MIVYDYFSEQIQMIVTLAIMEKVNRLDLTGNYIVGILNTCDFCHNT